MSSNTEITLKNQEVPMEQPSPSSAKKVLIILYYWPPAGGPGVQRWLNFAKFLPEYGIEPVIYCPSNPTYPIVDTSLLKDIPKNLKILKQPIAEPYRLARLFSKSDAKTISSGIIPKKSKQGLLQRLMLYVRGNFFIPDARKNWVKPSVDYLGEVIQQLQIKTIITTGPPHSLHLIGMDLKSKFSVNWIADFRDPWTTIGYHKKLKLSSSAKRRHQQLEKEVLASADQLIVTSFHTKKEFQQKTKQPITVITNGFNPYRGESVKKSENFTVAHIGSLLSERNPISLWKALSELINEEAEFSTLFHLNLYGVVSEDIMESLRNFGLLDHTTHHGYVSHEEALKAQRQNQLLLLIEIDSEDTKAIIPGKLFEYMAAKTPIIAIGPRGSDVETLLYNSSAGNYFDYEQKDLIKTQIRLHFEAFKTDTLKANSVDIEQYSRKNLTQQLANVILGI